MKLFDRILHDDPLPDVMTKNPPRPRQGDLGPNQIAWCRGMWPVFRDANDRAQAAIADTVQSRESVKETTHG